MLGYIYAVISSLFFSFYIVPRKLSKLSPPIFSLIMSLGFFIGTVSIYFLFPGLHAAEKPSWVLLWSLLAGIIWAGAFVAFVISIDYLGLARSNQWKNFQGPFGVLFALTILGEAAQANPLYAIIAAIFVFSSAFAFTISHGVENIRDERRGIYLALISALGFGTVATIQKYVTTQVGIYSQQVVWSGSIFLCLLIYILLKKKFTEIKVGTKKDLLFAFVGGLLYLGASFFQLFSYKYIPASIGFTIIQMNALWTIAIGIFVFKEIDLQKHYKRVLLGLASAILGIVILTLARK